MASGALAWMILSWTRRAFCDSTPLCRYFLEFFGLLAKVLEFPLDRLFSVGIDVQEFLHLEERKLFQDHGGFHGGHGHLKGIQFFLGLGEIRFGGGEPGFPDLEVLLQLGNTLLKAPDQGLGRGNAFLRLLRCRCLGPD